MSEHKIKADKYILWTFFECLLPSCDQWWCLFVCLCRFASKTFDLGNVSESSYGLYRVVTPNRVMACHSQIYIIHWLWQLSVLMGHYDQPFNVAL